MEEIAARAGHVMPAGDRRAIRRDADQYNQRRRRREHERTGEMEGGADGALVVSGSIVGRRAIGRRRGGLQRRGEVLGMDMRERQRELKRQRQEREPPAQPPMRANPSQAGQ